MLTIVVIEEDVAMRTLFSEWLAAEGYRVRGRADRGTARDDEVDLVVVDLLDLPNQGARTVREVKDLYPRAALIGISTQLSRTFAGDSAHARALGVSRLVPKPCGRSELVGAVVDAIGIAT